MIFTRSWALVLFGAWLILAGLFMASFRRKERLFRLLGEPEILKKLMDPFAPRRQRVKAVFALLGVGLLILAAAGPRWGQKFQEVQRSGVDVIIAVDVSASMSAEDIKPHRLAQAKRELSLLINGLEGDRVGLIAFAGTAFLQCPLTLDYGAARLLLDIIDFDLISTPGTSLASAIETACDAFVRQERKHKALILLTDGEDHSQRLPAALKRAKNEGVRILSIGFGSPQGEIIPIRDAQGNLTEYKKDKSGQTVVSKLNESALTELASATGGQYYRATRGEIEVPRILNDLKNMEKKSLESRVYGHTEDRFLWPLLLAFFFLLVEFLWPESGGGHFRWFLQEIYRRGHQSFKVLRGKSWPAGTKGALGGFILMFLLPSPANTMGKTPRADRAYARQDYANAARHYQKASQKNPADPQIRFNLGDALYRQNDFSGAQEAFHAAREASTDPRFQSQNAYNSGNALFRQQKYQEALEQFRQALRLNPGDMDAKHNLEFTQKMIQAQKDGKKPDSSEQKPSPDDSKSSETGEDKKEAKSKAPADQQKGMSREDAERILQSLEGQEKEARRKTRRTEPSAVAVEEDW